MSRAPDASPAVRGSVGRSWAAGLVMSFSGLAQAGEGVCSGGQCGATGIAPAVLRKAARGTALDVPLTPRPPQARLAIGTPDAAAAWKRRFGVADGREAYDCALSVGLGASLGGEGFLATRLLGRTQVWRDAAAR